MIEAYDTIRSINDVSNPKRCSGGLLARYISRYTIFQVRAICADSSLEFAISQSISVVPCVFGKPPIFDERLFPNAIRVFGWGHLVDNANQAGLLGIDVSILGTRRSDFICRL